MLIPEPASDLLSPVLFLLVSLTRVSRPPKKSHARRLLAERTPLKRSNDFRSTRKDIRWNDQAGRLLLALVNRYKMLQETCDAAWEYVPQINASEIK